MTLIGLIWLASFLSHQGNVAIQGPFKVPKTHVLNPATHRMISAIALRGQQAWFFKLTGPIDQVQPHVKDYTTFLESIRFDENSNDEPTWKLPAGWSLLPGSRMRFATIQIDSAGRGLDLSVTNLPVIGEEQEYILNNINRWRRQLKLPGYAQDDLAAKASQLRMQNADAMLVDMEGRMEASNQPMAGGMQRPAAAGPAPAGRALAGPAAGQASSLKFDTPGGWQSLGASGMRKADFSISSPPGEEPSEKAKVTIIDLSASAGELLPNVNRWRGQVGLTDVDQAQLDQQLEGITVDGAEGHYVKLIGPASEGRRPQAILGVILIRGVSSWFVKMQGDAALAQKEEEKFKTFAKSVKFSTE